MKKLMKLVDLGEPTSFADHVCLDAFNVNANQTKTLRSTERCSNHESLLERLRSYLGEKIASECDRLVL